MAELKKTVDNSDTMIYFDTHPLRGRERRNLIANVLEFPALNLPMNRGKPGEVIKAMSKVIRERLQSLTSKDWEELHSDFPYQREDDWTTIEKEWKKKMGVR
jgi:hypothetical protein